MLKAKIEINQFFKKEQKINKTQLPLTFKPDDFSYKS